jgi:hypothetical protein
MKKPVRVVAGPEVLMVSEMMTAVGFNGHTDRKRRQKVYDMVGRSAIFEHAEVCSLVYEKEQAHLPTRDNQEC